MKRKKILNLTMLVRVADDRKQVIADDWKGSIPANLALSFPGYRLFQLFRKGLYEYKKES